jgi:hypothetical protein
LELELLLAIGLMRILGRTIRDKARLALIERTPRAGAPVGAHTNRATSARRQADRSLRRLIP